jgi:hypothetical protein
MQRRFSNLRDPGGCFGFAAGVQTSRIAVGIVGMTGGSLLDLAALAMEQVKDGGWHDLRG